MTSTTLQLASFQPGLFNVNGDQANLEILAAEANWAGLRCEISLLGEDAVGPDLLLLGSAARRTMRVFEPELEHLVPALRERHRLAKPTLYIGSSFERFAKEVFGQTVRQTPRLSDYYRGDYQGQQLRGYLNTAVDLPALVIDSKQIASSLSGPLLAKNRWLLAEIALWLGFELRTPEPIIELQRRLSTS